MKWNYIFAGFLVSQSLCVSQVIKISDGLIRGKYITLPSGKAVLAYRGIPFAKPPIGNLRFKHPLPAEQWTGVLNTTEYGKSCVQPNLATFKSVEAVANILPTTKFSEDCLTLNVFVPVPSPFRSSVMVFVHGGGYSVGGSSAVFHDGATLSGEENVIVVSMNYRLAALGFLYLDHPSIEPNCGLMDQLLAFNWVKNNIKYFGGNPEDVTLFGNSGGASSVGYHMASPLSEGLYKRVILQSGSPMARFLIQEKEQNIKVAYQTVSRLGCNEQYGSGLDEIVRCLMEADAESILKSEPRHKLYFFNFKPVYDERFFKGHPINSTELIKIYRKTDLLTGVVQNEGTLFLSLVKPIVFVPFFDKIGPYHNELMEGVRDILLPNQTEIVYKAVELMYTDWALFNDSASTLESSDTCLKDFVFSCPMKDFANLYAEVGANVFIYQFTYRSSSRKYGKWLGVPHTEELRYLSAKITPESGPLYEKDMNFSKTMLRYWANFARTGNPNISPPNSDPRNLTKWPQYTLDNREALVLNPNVNGTVKMQKGTKCTFWSEFMPELQKI